jgi:hypothetical protein
MNLLRKDNSFTASASGIGWQGAPQHLRSQKTKVEATRK